MTYFGFLALFLCIPIVTFMGLAWFDHRRSKTLPATMMNWPAWMVILVHVVIAVTWTTPWDNYLVATNVWWYDVNLVTGVTIWYVPIEEYAFFVLQPIMTGLWLVFLARYLPLNSGFEARKSMRVGAVAAAGFVWLLSLMMLISPWRLDTYLGLELIWALPPMALQLSFGADILWHKRRIVLMAIVVPTLYLSFADALAIESGTWTIDPEQSLGIYLGGVLPIEEFIFFLLTNTLITFGATLALASESKERLQNWFTRRLVRAES